MRALIEVTQQDIDAGAKRHCTSCPVALAISRAMGGGMVVVRYRTWSAPGLCASGGLPPSVTEFIRSFDAGRAVDPIKFRITLPDAA